MTDHDAVRESAGLYVLGALAGDERRAFEQHLETCARCAAEVRTLAGVAGALPYASPQVDPPYALRERVLAIAGGRPSPRSLEATPANGAFVRRAAGRGGWVGGNAGWLSAAAMAVMVAGLGVYATGLRSRIGGLELELRDAVTRLERSEQQLAEATSLAERAQVRTAVLMSPDLRQVELTGQPAAPAAAGRAFWSAANGLVFTATALPALPPGRTYQLWILRMNDPAPASAGLVVPDDNGRVVTSFESPAGAGTPSGFALSIEPEGGVPAPTGALYLVGRSGA